MSRFISLSSTNKIFGMINLSRGSPFRLPPTCLRVCYKGGCSAPRDRARAASAMLFYKDGKTVAINRLDKIIRGPQIKAQGFIVDNRDHDDRNFHQCGIALQFLDHCPAVAVRHNHRERDNHCANLPLKTPTLLADL